MREMCGEAGSSASEKALPRRASRMQTANDAEGLERGTVAVHRNRDPRHQTTSLPALVATDDALPMPRLDVSASARLDDGIAPVATA